MLNYNVTSSAFFYIIKDIKEEIINGYINNVQNIDSEILKIKIHNKRAIELIITDKFALIANKKIPVTTAGKIANFLKTKIYNQRIKDVFQDKNNKVLVIKLDSYYLIFEFFSKSNIILTDLEFNVIIARMYETWKDRIIKPKQKYQFPFGKDIKTESFEDFSESIKDITTEKLIPFIIREYNIYPKTADYLIKKSKNNLEIYNNLKL
ncbi:MAG: hypothetical protein V1824_02135, partial [archaeon]